MIECVRISGAGCEHKFTHSEILSVSRRLETSHVVGTYNSGFNCLGIGNMTPYC